MRVDGHLFISILACHILHAIRYQLKQQDIHPSWDTIREILDTHMRISTTLLTKDNRKVFIRKNTNPQQSEIYKALEFNLSLGKTEETVYRCSANDGLLIAHKPYECWSIGSIRPKMG